MPAAEAKAHAHLWEVFDHVYRRQATETNPIEVKLSGLHYFSVSIDITIFVYI